MHCHLILAYVYTPAKSVMEPSVQDCHILEWKETDCRHGNVRKYFLLISFSVVYSINPDIVLSAGKQHTNEQLVGWTLDSILMQYSVIHFIISDI